MSWTRESLIAAALALFAPWAVADSITVNTTTDDFASNSLCSLREAVEYFNRGNPEGGFQGCVPKVTGGSGIITVPANDNPYIIDNKAITVRAPLTINGAGRKGDAITTLQVTGAHRAFIFSNNPQYTAPKCATGATVTCADNPSAYFDVDPISDTETAGDYLTRDAYPRLKGILPAQAALPNSFVVRVYQIPKTGDRIYIGQTKVAFSTSPIPWQVTVNSPLPRGVVHLGYTVETVVSATGAVVQEESALSDNTVRLAIYPAPSNDQIVLSQMVIKGGCETLPDCANDEDDNTTVTNPTTSASYDEYGLTYTNGIVNTPHNGGVIFNDEYLTLTDVWVEGGKATNGGALFVTAVAGANIQKSDFQANSADHGAAIYGEVNSVMLDNSLLHLNTVSGAAGGAVFEIGAGTLVPSVSTTRVTSSTISGNAGLGLSLVEGTYVNGATIVENTGGGLDFNGLDVRVYNTILAGNTGAPDCLNLPLSPVVGNNLVIAPASGGSCPTTDSQVIDNVSGGNGQLMATLVDGKCTSPYGILCPLADRGGATFVHVPRVLQSYYTDPLGIGASPVINKGFAGTTAVSNGACPNKDQRDMDRPLGLCDIGAAEFQDVGNGVMVGTVAVIKYGESYVGKLDAKLEDEELLPAADCPAADSVVVDGVAHTFPPASLAPDTTRVVPDTYNPVVPGCPWLEQAAARGTVTFDTDGSYTYKPSWDFHGFDVFDLRVVSTLSRMNDLPVDRSRVGRVKVIVEPATGMVSSKVGGGLDAFLLLGVMLLGVVRRGGRS